jgi:hypothetical protein
VDDPRLESVEPGHRVACWYPQTGAGSADSLDGKAAFTGEEAEPIAGRAEPTAGRAEPLAGEGEQP